MAGPLVTRGVVRDGGRVHVVEIEAAFMRGFAGIQVLGSLTDVVKNGRERARAALESLGVHLAAQKLVINFAPADIRIDGAQLDLPLAVALARVNGLPGGQEPLADRCGAVFGAEITLDGVLRPVPDIVALALGAAAAGAGQLIVAEENLKDLFGIDLNPLVVLGFGRLDGVLNWLGGEDSEAVLLSASEKSRKSGRDLATGSTGLDFRDMILTSEQAQAAVVAAAGAHHVLLRGTPGSGKTMFAGRLPGILPPLSGAVRLKCLELHSLAGSQLDSLRGGVAPFRSPHHSASMAAMLGTRARPGELPLAHGGILFLDELPEFRRDLLESLREPLESGTVNLARVQGQVCWPAQVVLIAASNNCPCGWFGSRFRRCRCSVNQVLAYQNRISGPLLDRIDLHVNMPERGHGPSVGLPQDGSGLVGSSIDVGCDLSIDSRVLSARVLGAVSFRRERHRRIGIDPDLPNGRLPDGLLGCVTGWELAGTKSVSRHVSGILRDSARELVQAVSSRGMGRAIRVARTLADVDRAESVGYEHLKQALQWQAAAAAKDRGDMAVVASQDRRANWHHNRLN